VSRVTSHRFRFGAFELDARTGELQRDGVIVQLQEQPLQLLTILLEHAGAIVTREDLRRELWNDRDPAEAERALATVVKRVRDALNDPSDNPVFIQTIARRGYRFLATVDSLPSDTIESGAACDEAVAATAAQLRSADHRPAHGVLFASVLVIVVAALVVLLAIGRRSPARSAAPVAGNQARLAVLPFDDLAGDDEQFFADGMHEEMIVRLGRLQPRRLGVIARASVLPYRGAAKSIATIARELGVDYVLEGSVRHVNDRVRITAQLIRADNQSRLWSETYDRSWNDIWAIQADVAARVADSLAVELVPPSEAAGGGGRHVTPQAYEHYLRGRFYWNQRGRDPAAQLARAIQEFQKAIAEQPEYAAAYGGLADAYDSVFFASPGFAGDVPERARQAIERALQLDPDLASAHSTQAWMTLHFDHDLTLAEQRFRRALELDPNDALTRLRLSHVLAARGRLRDAEDEALTARRYDPLSAAIADILAWYRYYAGANRDAIARMAEAADLDGTPTKRQVFAQYLDVVGGRCAEATLDVGAAPLASDMLRMGEVAFVTARCGDAASGDRLVRELATRRLAYPAAMFYFGRGQLDAFYEWLNRAIDQRFPEPLYIGVDPVFAPERQMPRFQAAMRRLGLK